MFEALTYQNMLHEIQETSIKDGILNDTIGILITRPDLSTGRNIADSLEYYHFRSGKTVNFYLPGYGAYWSQQEHPDEKIVTIVNGVKWSFSNEMFVDFINDLEDHSQWRYSGESELLLVELKDGILSYENAIQLYLDKMLRDKVVESVHGLFEDIIRNTKKKDSISGVSNTLGTQKLKQLTRKNILYMAPFGLGKVITQEKYFCMKDLSI